MENGQRCVLADAVEIEVGKPAQSVPRTFSASSSYLEPEAAPLLLDGALKKREQERGEKEKRALMKRDRCFSAFFFSFFFAL